MTGFRRSVRTLHRWLSPVFVIAVVVSLIFTGVGGSQDSPLFAALGVVTVAAILTLLVTGMIMFFQYYWPRWQAASQRKQARG